MKQDLLNQIENLLPQTQCQACGYNDCHAYAQAIVENNAKINLCTAATATLSSEIAQIMNCEDEKININKTKMLAKIDENECIGCTACIRKCPVDAIVGATKLMHTVISNECTGCGLCIEACPIDCMSMYMVDDEFLPRNTFLSNHKQQRFAASEHAKLRYLSKIARKQSNSEKTNQTPINLDINSILHQAKTKSANKKRITTTSSDLEKRKLEMQIEKANNSNIRRKIRYGDEK